MSGIFKGRKWPRAALLALRELVISVLRIVGILSGIILAFGLLAVSWRACNAHRVSTFCDAPGETRGAVIQRARSEGLEVFAEPNARHVAVLKRSWAGVGICIITFEGDRIVGAKFEDS